MGDGRGVKASFRHPTTQPLLGNTEVLAMTILTPIGATIAHEENDFVRVPSYLVALQATE